MSDRPPQQPLTEAERDAILRRLDQTVTLFSRQVQSHGTVLEDHEKRIATLETQVLAGVHAAPGDSIPVYHDDPKPDHLSMPLPPMRGPMSTHEQLHALTEKQAEMATKAEVIETKTDEQTSMLQKMGAQQRQALAMFIGAILMAMLNQCQPATLQAWLPHRAAAPVPVTTLPSPAPSR
jgi:hypothetical protein